MDIGGHAEKLRETSPSFYCDAAVVALMRSFLYLFVSVTCPRCVHRVSMSDDSQITVGAQSELSQSYSQSSVRAGVFTRYSFFLKKSVFPLLLKGLGGFPPIFIFDGKNPALTEL